MITNAFTAKYIANVLRRGGSGLERLSTILLDAKVDLNPHQISAAVEALDNPYSKGRILADEVGLGKTIEAAIIIAEKWTEEKRNILVVVPATLNATQVIQNLTDEGFTLVPFGQGFKDMSPATKELMKLVLEGKLAHGGHEALRWMVDNIFVRTDPAGNVKPDKEKSTEKIDGAVAMIMALDRAMRNGGGGGSVYDERGLIII